MPSSVPFEPIADSLRATLDDAAIRRRHKLKPGDAGDATARLNSTLIAERAAPLIDMVQQRGLDSLEGRSVLDLGCGLGGMSLYFASQGATVVGADAAKRRLEVGRKIAAKHQLPASFIATQMESLELPDAQFDVVVQSGSLCYLVDRDERARALDETYRVLRPGGWLVIRNPNRWWPIDQYTHLPLVSLLSPGAAARASRLLRRKRSAVRLVSPPSARRELRRAGFVDVHVERPTNRRMPAIARYVSRYQHLTAQRPDEPG